MDVTLDQRCVSIFLLVKKIKTIHHIRYFFQLSYTMDLSHINEKTTRYNTLISGKQIKYKLFFSVNPL